jgi:very-short-patch-repair endonuclease
MTALPTKFPWLDIIRFHKDFVQLEQENFFQIPVNNPAGKPDALKAFVFPDITRDSIDSPWIVPDDKNPIDGLLLEIKRGNLKEGYIGGPCWSGSSKSGDSWVPFISPFLYQHARVEYDPEKKEILFIPDEGRWEISPVVCSLLDRLECAPDTPFEELPFKVLENARQKSKENNTVLSENLVDVICAELPPLAGKFRDADKNRGQKSGTKNPWIFFVPPSAENSYVKYIMPDYQALEQRLARDPSDIGGFRIFESDVSEWVGAGQKKDLVPVVPLNASQERAVENILENKPVTVISGPPGCGKSQVVVSLLVNAWKEGKTVLFASTTKAAVDVVYDRLRDFECDYPLAVRAGAKDRNTIEASLEKLRYVTLQDRYVSGHDLSLKKQIDELSEKKREYQRFLDDKIPQRITQAKQAASRSFLEFREVTEKIAQNREKFQNEASGLGYSLLIDKFEDEVCESIKRWWDEKKNCRKTIGRDDEQREEYAKKIAACECERDRLLGERGCGNLSPDGYSWLVTGPGPDRFEKWLDDYRALLNADIEQYYASDPGETYKKWSSESDARTWVATSENLLLRIDNLVSVNKEKFSRYTALKGQYDKARADLLDTGLSTDIPFARPALVSWKQSYSALLSIPDGLLSFMKRRSAEKSLREIEHTLQSYYPSEVWTVFSRDPAAGRKTLDGLIDTTLRWMEVSEKWITSPDRTQIENELRDISELKSGLHLQNFMINYRDDFSFVEIARRIRDLEPDARKAVETWCVQTKKEEFLRSLKMLILHFDRFTISCPLVKAWSEHEGSELAGIFQALKERPAFELVTQSWNYCSADRFTRLLSGWKRSRELQTNIDEYARLCGEIPSRQKRIAGWWAQRPAICVIGNGDSTSFPQEDTVLYRHLEACENLKARWNENCRTELHELEKQQKDSFDRALRDMKISSDNIPWSLRDTALDSLFASILNQSMSAPVWLNDDDNQLFDRFDPERIRASLNSVNSQLADLSFKLAKECYLKRIAEGSYILESVDKLRRHLTRSSSFSARGFPRETYLNALKAIPVWVTNAHQTQSFPLEPDLFDVLVIDEASQCTLTNILPLIYRAKSLAVIGDPNQLPAIFKDISLGKEAAFAAKHSITGCADRFGHRNNTLFQLGLTFLPGGRKNMVNLIEHYRSHPLIIGFSNLYIYQMHLTLKKKIHLNNRACPVSGVFGLDVPGECFRGSRGQSWVNPKEAQAICDIVKSIRSDDTFFGKTIGIVTQFRGQKDKIEELLSMQGLFSKDILVGTVDTFQGNEKDIMFFSPVLSKGIGEPAARWSDDKNRINVALTRARELMIVVGDFTYCRKMDAILRNLIEYVETISLLRKTSAAELELFSLLITEGNALKLSRDNLPHVHQRIGSIEVDFVLRNPEKGAALIIEVDGDQHYYAGIMGTRCSVDYEGIKKFVNSSGKKLYVNFFKDEEFVNLNNRSYRVTTTRESIQADKSRDDFLKTQGYKILRVPAKDIFEKPDVVMQEISQSLEISGK